jgi:hypothetical protein
LIRLHERLSQHASRGALPTLYAAVGEEVVGGDYIGPRHWFGLGGPPTHVKLPKRALDEAAATELWVRSEALTGVAFRFATRARPEAAA